MMRNAAERKDIRAAEKVSARLDRDRFEFIGTAMSTIHGRVYFYDLLVRTHAFASSFTGEALSSAFAEGERNIGLQVYNDIMLACPEQFISMMREANEREKAYERSSDTGSPDDGDDYASDGPTPSE